MKTFLIFSSIVILVNVVIISGVDAAEKPCNSQKDCTADAECCVSRWRPKGRKRREAALGICKKLGTQGSACFVEPWYDNGLNVAECYCARSYFCKGTNVHDQPLGEMGICTRSK